MTILYTCLSENSERILTPVYHIRFCHIRPRCIPVCYIRACQTQRYRILESHKPCCQPDHTYDQMMTNLQSVNVINIHVHVHIRVST